MSRAPEVPARRALREAEQNTDRLGHENLGFLSEAHGFMPREPPRLRLPVSHEAWDSVGARLPELFRSLTLRRALDQMPVLGAGEDDLADQDLLRASTLIGIFAHAYFYADPDPSSGTPESIGRPWQQLCRRLGHAAPHLSFTDLNVYNWRFIYPDRPSVTVENLRLLVPILGNEAERRFQMTPVEMLARFTPVIGATVRAQEAVAADDPEALEQELGLILETVEKLTFDSFSKVDPNPYSEHYVDPVVWGKTVAPIATPFQSDPPPGPSGTAIPAFQLLDSLFGRTAFATSVGVETARVRRWFPQHWREFLDAADTVSVPAFVARTGRRSLLGTFQDAAEAYAGEAGLLGRHRLKVFGYLDLSFKAGRSKTLGGFGGGFADRLWDRMDVELDLARLERYPSSPQTCHHVRVQRVDATTTDEAGWIGEVALDVSGAGIRYRPGSRCSVLPENDPVLVERTLRALRARGDEPIQLNGPWQEAVKLRDGYQHARVLSLRSLLTFGRIRPVTRPVAKALFTVSRCERLRRVVEARSEDQWELWQLLETLAETGFKPTELLKAHPGQPESISWLVPPETFRMFSISSSMNDTHAPMAERIDLTVRRLRYQTEPTELSPEGICLGTGSSFVCRQAPVGEGVPSRRLSIRVAPSAHFGLPGDPTQPMIMFAGGTGLSPFIGMLAERASQGLGENWLFLSTRTLADLPRRVELTRLVEAGNLNLRIAFSREQLRGHSVLSPSGTSLVFETGPAQHIDEEMRRDENAEFLWELLRERRHGGLEGCFFVCGSTGFARSVSEAVKGVLVRHGTGTGRDPDGAWVGEFLNRLVGTNRYRQEIFTTYAGPVAKQHRLYDASELVCHNDEVNGYWMAIDGRVYDLTDFAGMHPGGPKILRSYAGMDATDAYRRARHDVNPEVDAMLGMHQIGAVRRLDLGGASAVALGPRGLRLVTVKDVYRAWIELLYLTVEIENAVGNDYAVRFEPVTYDEQPEALRVSPYKLRLLVQAHRRFVDEYLPLILGDRFQHLWRVTSALDSEHHHPHEVQRAIGAAMSGAPAAGRIVARLVDVLGGRSGLDGTPEQATLVWCDAGCQALEAADRWILDTVKNVLRAGIQIFERHQKDTFSMGATELVAAAASISPRLATYWDRVATSVSPSR